MLLITKIKNYLIFAFILNIACSSEVPDKIIIQIKSVNNKSDIDFYSSQSIMTDPGKYAYLYQELPIEVSKLCEIVQGLLIHEAHTHLYGVNISNKRIEKEIKIRKVEAMLDRIMELDNRKIFEAREPQNRLVGNCRDFSVLLCSFLRHKKIPARARVGYENYSNSWLHGDHWICEYLDVEQTRWIQVDAQLDAIQLRSFNIKFDPLDLPDNKFIVAGKAYKMCITNNANPDNFGVDYNLRGLGHIKGNLILDFLALNKLELLPWDQVEVINSIRYSSTEKSALPDSISIFEISKPFGFEEIQNLYYSYTDLRMQLIWKP